MEEVVLRMSVVELLHLQVEEELQLPQVVEEELEQELLRQRLLRQGLLPQGPGN